MKINFNSRNYFSFILALGLLASVSGYAAQQFFSGASANKNWDNATPTNTWFDMAGSSASNTNVININAANPTVFYRLRMP
jgi:hypothetical protein